MGLESIKCGSAQTLWAQAEFRSAPLRCSQHVGQECWPSDRVWPSLTSRAEWNPYPSGAGIRNQSIIDSQNASEQPVSLTRTSNGSGGCKFCALSRQVISYVDFREIGKISFLHVAVRIEGSTLRPSLPSSAPSTRSRVRPSQSP